MVVLIFENCQVVFISPHADDVAWSCGGVAAAIAKITDVFCVNVFDGAVGGEVKHICDKHSLSRMAHSGLRRQHQDRQAMKSIGVKRISIGLKEAVFRRGNNYPLYSSALSIRRSVHPKDFAMEDVVTALVPLLKSAHIIFVPICEARSHVDHIISRDAVLASAPLDARILYYLEFPYSNGSTPTGFRERFIECDYQAWRTVALFYKTEISKYFTDDKTFAEKLDNWIDCVRGDGRSDHFRLFEK